jgi:hypothetical protein
MFSRRVADAALMRCGKVLGLGMQGVEGVRDGNIKRGVGDEKHHFLG